mmetsp:Transcript_35111/g.105907  ORF Transcript_35111/g.105907 Transcript_35111/m.105907 type:complete len:249 (-) Transcript_35111:3-749(-)
MESTTTRRTPCFTITGTLWASSDRSPATVPQCSTYTLSPTALAASAGHRPPHVSASCAMRLFGNASSVQMKTAPPPSPPADGGSCTVRASCKQNCVLAEADSPTTSVSPRVSSPPRRTLSRTRQPDVSRAVRWAGSSSSMSAVTAVPPNSASAAATLAARAAASERAALRASSGVDSTSRSAHRVNPAFARAAACRGSISSWATFIVGPPTRGNVSLPPPPPGGLPPQQRLLPLSCLWAAPGRGRPLR